MCQACLVVKTAAELINAYGDLDALLEHAREIKQPKRRENLIEHAEMARISRKLVRLDDYALCRLPWRIQPINGLIWPL